MWAAVKVPVGVAAATGGVAGAQGKLQLLQQKVQVMLVAAMLLLLVVCASLPIALLESAEVATAAAESGRCTDIGDALHHSPKAAAVTGTRVLRAAIH
jgi:hypothetical protein